MINVVASCSCSCRGKLPSLPPLFEKARQWPTDHPMEGDLRYRRLKIIKTGALRWPFAVKPQRPASRCPNSCHGSFAYLYSATNASRTCFAIATVNAPCQNPAANMRPTRNIPAAKRPSRTKHDAARLTTDRTAANERVVLQGSLFTTPIHGSHYV